MGDAGRVDGWPAPRGGHRQRLLPVPRPEAGSDGAIDDFARAQGDDISTLEKPLKELGPLQVSCLILICLAAWVWMFVVWLDVLCIADGDLDF